MKLNVNLPTIIEVDDYHDFLEHQMVLRKVIPGVKFRECGFNNNYLAVFYVGKVTDPVVKAKIREAKKIVQTFWKGDEDFKEKEGVLN